MADWKGVRMESDISGIVQRGEKWKQSEMKKLLNYPQQPIANVYVKVCPLQVTLKSLWILNSVNFNVHSGIHVGLHYMA